MIGTIVKKIVVGAIVGVVAEKVVDGATVLIKGTAKSIKSSMDNSERVQEIKKDFNLRREGIITVDYEEV